MVKIVFSSPEMSDVQAQAAIDGFSTAMGFRPNPKSKTLQKDKEKFAGEHLMEFFLKMSLVVRERQIDEQKSQEIKIEKAALRPVFKGLPSIGIK